MMALLISGRDIASDLLEKELIPRVQKLNKKSIQPRLVVILVGNHNASASYVRQKEKFAAKAGIIAETWRYDADVSEEKILSEIEKINQDSSIHGVIVQLPLPDHIAIQKVLNTIDPAKDVDGFTPTNVGRLFLNEPCLQCCTPKGIIRMIKESGEDLVGKNVVVIGKSNIVGKPVSVLALNERATVTTCHSKTKDLKKMCEDADIIIVAVGIPHFLKADIVPEGAVIIDVGIHADPAGGLCGDVDFEAVSKKAKAISPVPGGVGPMTVFCLIENTIEAAESMAA